MKKDLITLILLLLICSFSCKKEQIQTPLSVSEFYNYTNGYNTPCNGKLNHEGEKVLLTGYVFKINIFPENNWLRVFENSSDRSLDMSLNLKENQKEIYNKILEKMSNSTYLKIDVQGKITGHPQAMNGSCSMGAVIEIDDAKDIRFE